MDMKYPRYKTRFLLDVNRLNTGNLYDSDKTVK